MYWIAVAFGGAIGALGRYAISLYFTQMNTKFPVATFTANTIGCFLMGLGFILITERQIIPEVWRHVLLVGFLGAFTTFSTFSIEAVNLIQADQWKLACLYVFSSVAVCISAAVAGSFLAKMYF